MKKTPNIRMVGIFTIIGIIIFIGIVLFFVGDRIFQKDNNRLVMYFEESIQGLSIGSVVSFKGVEIGRITRIDIVADIGDLNFSIPVYARLSDDQNFRVQTFRKIKDKDLFLKDLVAKGLRARLSTQSYLTGQSMIELEIIPNSPAVYKSKHLADGMIEIPTVLSPLGEISKGLQDLPVKQLIEQFNILVDIFNKKFPIILDNTADISTNINNMMPKMYEILNQTSKFTTTLNKYSPEIFKNSNKSLELINNAMTNNSGRISLTIDALNQSITDIGNAARSLRNLTDYIERHPEALLRGKKE